MVSQVVSSIAGGVTLSIALLVLYIWRNDRKLLALPPDALAFSPERATASMIQQVANSDFAGLNDEMKKQLPPATGRRYVVVGGAGFVGGWIVLHLLERGEDPRRIRVLDIRLPTRPDLLQGAASRVDYRAVDITDAAATHAAFTDAWPVDVADAPLSVFHTASNIRFWERARFLVPLSARVNIGGTENVLNAARAAGADVLVYTSSASVSIYNNRFLLWPWESRTRRFVQVLIDDDNLGPKTHADSWSNYAYTKLQAEGLVRKADRTVSGKGMLRTGAIRPGNGIYGPGGDVLAEAYLVRGTNPTWIQNIVENFCYVEHASLAHLCYEQRLIELHAGTPNPDIGGQAFIVTDPGRPVTYGDVYLTLTTLTNGETQFPLMSPTFMYLLALAIEAIYLTRRRLLDTPFRAVANLLPALTSDIGNLQPSLYGLTLVHLIFDDSRARLPPAKGGLGYKGVYHTLPAMAKLVNDFKRSDRRGGERSMSGGVSFGFGASKVQKKLGDLSHVAGSVDVTAPIKLNAD